MFPPAISTNHKPGFVIIAVSVVVTALLFLAGYLVEQSISEIRIARSENSATKAYYLAEAGANEAIYLLKNNSSWTSGFIGGTLNNQTSVRSNVFDANGSYTISGTSVSAGIADIFVTGIYLNGSQQAKRGLQIRLARATNSASTWTQSFYAGGSGDQDNGKLTTERNCTINGGVIHANQTVKVTSKSTLTVNNASVSASNNITVNSGSNLVLVNSTQQEGSPTIGMPQIDFDSNSATSLKNRANQVYTTAAFSALPDNTILNGITFITGTATWTNKNLTINGILAASDDIHISLNSGKTITVNSDSLGSGIMSKDDLEIGLTAATLNASGLIFASKELEVETSGNVSFTITGGLIGWHVEIEGADTGTCDITYDEQLASTPLDPVYNGSESPIIELNHWEEQY